jgi:polyhydroxyalkanoate synthase
MGTPEVQGTSWQIAFADTSGNSDVVGDYLAMQSWLADTTPWHGEAYRTYIKECYQENHLITGKLVVGGQRVDLNDIHCALLTVTAANDQLCPSASTTVLNDVASSTDKELLQLQGSHVSIIAGRNAPHQWHPLAAWLLARSTHDRSA